MSSVLTKNSSQNIKHKDEGPRYLPGDAPSWQNPIHAMIRVNLAGEYGAKRIYQGQIDNTEPGESRDLLIHMKEQEDVHLTTFQDIAQKRHVRPTILTPLWHNLGYLMGAVTARMGNTYSMAATSAVEEVIDQHYADQLTHLQQYPQENNLTKMVEKFREEELEHRDIGYEYGAHQAPAPVMPIIRFITQKAIFLSERF